MKKIVFWGARGHAKVLRELVEHLGYALIATFDNDAGITAPFPDVPIYYGTEGFENWKRKYEGVDVAGLVAIGGVSGRARLEIQQFLKSKQVRPITAVHRTAFVASDATIREGSQVLANAAVCSEVSMGEACIINTASSVDHESVLGDGVHIAPGATLAGRVSVGDYSLIGPGAIVLPRVRIGRDVIVGAGAVVTKDIPDNKIAFGNPATERRDNTGR